MGMPKLDRDLAHQDGPHVHTWMPPAGHRPEDINFRECACGEIGWLMVNTDQVVPQTTTGS